MNRAVQGLQLLAMVVAIGSAWHSSVEWAVAQPPIRLEQYRFLPERSTIQVTGGFAGVDFTSPVFGQFGLAHGYEQTSDQPPRLDPFAAFVDVEAYFHFNPAWVTPPPPQVDLDAALNLTGLEGTFDAVDSPGRFVFTGVDGQGAPIRIVAQQHERALRLSGASAPGCCDFFQYTIDALALRQPWGDFDSNGRVDMADHVVWRDTFGSTTDLRADADADGQVTAADFTLWRDSYGHVMDEDVVLSTAASIPEPGSLVLLMLGTFGIGFRRRISPAIRGHRNV